MPLEPRSPVSPLSPRGPWGPFTNTFQIKVIDTQAQWKNKIKFITSLFSDILLASNPLNRHCPHGTIRTALVVGLILNLSLHGAPVIDLYILFLKELLDLELLCISLKENLNCFIAVYFVIPFSTNMLESRIFPILQNELKKKIEQLTAGPREPAGPGAPEGPAGP